MVKSTFIEKLPAPITKRIFAYIVDVLIVNLIIVLPLRNTIESIFDIEQQSFYATYQYFIQNPSKLTQIFILSVIIAILGLTYWSVLEFKLRQSIGKIIMNIKVASKVSKFTFSQCIVRNISKVFTIILALDVVYLIINRQRHQRYFEKISNTIVIEEVTKI